MVALSGPLDSNKLDPGLAVLRDWGHPIVAASNLECKEAYLAGSDAERLAGVNEVLDEGVRWIVAARGGYGAGRLLDDMPWRTLVDR